MKKIVIGTLGLLLGYAVPATAGQVHFSADAVMKTPATAPQKGNLYVGTAGTRFDFTQNGQSVSKIELSSQGLTRILFHGDKTYMEFALPALNNYRIGHSARPCKPAPNLGCKKTGDVQFNNMNVERWSVLPKGAPKPIEILWDKSRKMTVSQVFPNGARISNKMLGTEKYENLDIERWETAMTAPDGKTLKGSMLYAPNLEVAVVEKQPDGLVKELHNIKMAEPDAALFRVPAGYTKRIQPATTGSIK